MRHHADELLVRTVFPRQKWGPLPNIWLSRACRAIFDQPAISQPALQQFNRELGCVPPLQLLECDPDKIDGGVTGVAGFVLLADVDGFHQAH